jgi:hypothetical protein
LAEVPSVNPGKVKIFQGFSRENLKKPGFLCDISHTSAAKFLISPKPCIDKGYKRFKKEPGANRVITPVK